MKSIWHPMTEAPTHSALIMEAWTTLVPTAVNGKIKILNPVFYNLETPWETFIQGRKGQEWAYYSEWVKPTVEGENKMKIKTRWDAVNYLEKIENELDEVCNNNCEKCPFDIDGTCMVSEDGYVDIYGALKLIKKKALEEEPIEESFENISFTVKNKFSKETCFTVKNNFEDYYDGCPMAKYEIFCKPCKENGGK